jgi:hypothetical protein
MNLEDYLNHLQRDESIFPMDSYHKKKKPFKGYYYPESALIFVEQRRAMIDLDGTIHKYSKGYDDGSIYDDPFKGAREVIAWLKDQGFEIVIFTTRASNANAEEMGGDSTKEIRNVENWLTDNDIYFDRVTADKLAADFYIDDKAIEIKNGDWNAVKNVIKKRIKYKAD